MVEKGLVKVNNKTVFKPSFEVNDENVEIIDNLPFVSKGGDKLERGITAFDYSVLGKVFIDVGASNGGFTDCLLSNGAKKVYAVDVGENQLDEKLRNNDKVVIMDKTNAKDLKKEMFEEKEIYAVSDVSFISLTFIIPVLAKIAKEFILLIKPQFECGKKALNKNGIVTSKTDRANAVIKVKNCGKESGFNMSKIEIGASGKNKNTEYVALFNLESILTDEDVIHFCSNNE